MEADAGQRITIPLIRYRLVGQPQSNLNHTHTHTHTQTISEVFHEIILEKLSMKPYQYLTILAATTLQHEPTKQITHVSQTRLVPSYLYIFCSYSLSQTKPSIIHPFTQAVTTQ